MGASVPNSDAASLRVLTLAGHICNDWPQVVIERGKGVCVRSMEALKNQLYHHEDFLMSEENSILPDLQLRSIFPRYHIDNSCAATSLMRSI